MIHQVKRLLNKKYHQNYILNNPYIGSLIIFIFCLVFLSIYKPLNTHGAQNLSYRLTMTIYCAAFSFSVFIIITLLKKIKYFSGNKDWTILKEFISIVLCLFSMGIAIYFAGFFVEEPYQRWNIFTFVDSCLSAFLIGIIPFMFFTIINFRSFRTYNLSQTVITDPDSIELKEEKIQINSKLKKERLSFLPSQFFFAMSDGNYVIFYLNRNNKIEKEIIRNSIGNIEKQLSQISFFMRTHRAFIVNVKKVHIKNGNTSGYHLKISDIDMDIPVSRQYAQDFIQLYNQFE
jgi:hypothetical protein